MPHSSNPPYEAARKAMRRANFSTWVSDDQARLEGDHDELDLHYSSGAITNTKRFNKEEAIQIVAALASYLSSEDLTPEARTILDLYKMSREMHTQDDMGTPDPLFSVMEYYYRYLPDLCVWDEASWSWVCNEEGDTVEQDTVIESICEDLSTPNAEDMYAELQPAELEALSERYSRVPYVKHEKFVTTFFTRRAAQHFIDTNDHNLVEPFIYTHSAYRNYEWQYIRTYLLGLTPPPSADEQNTD
jgi:hypothetical protein